MSNSLQKLNLALPIGSLEAYVSWTQRIPTISVEEERQLAYRFYNDKDLEAAKQLILAHLRYVVRIARTYSGYGLSQADLIQEGNIGLMKAVKRFNPDVGVRLISFAVHWIKAEIHEFILRNWRIVKVATTKAQRKLFFNLRKASKHLSWFSDEEAKAVARDLNVTAQDVRLMETRLSAHDEAFSSFESEEQDSATWSPENYLEDNRYNPALQLENADWSENREQKLQQALTLLDERSRDILQKRWLNEDKATLHELAAKYDVSAERIRQIERLAMDKLKTAITAAN